MTEGIDLTKHPILGFLIAEEFQGLFQFAKDHGYQESEEGYLSKCDLCLDIRKFLEDKGNFKELAPKAFYKHVG